MRRGIREGVVINPHAVKPHRDAFDANHKEVVACLRELIARIERDEVSAIAAMAVDGRELGEIDLIRMGVTEM
ncbi:MAG: hypothetical protein ACYCUI_12420 [Vulcanimicrobiaceae bacterium]|nr:hypothetical protein [Pseudomonadota bacterium]